MSAKFPRSRVILSSLFKSREESFRLLATPTHLAEPCDGHKESFYGIFLAHFSW